MEGLSPLGTRTTQARREPWGGQSAWLPRPVLKLATARTAVTDPLICVLILSAFLAATSLLCALRAQRPLRKQPSSGIFKKHWSRRLFVHYSFVPERPLCFPTTFPRLRLPRISFFGKFPLEQPGCIMNTGPLSRVGWRGRGSKPAVSQKVAVRAQPPRALPPASPLPAPRRQPCSSPAGPQTLAHRTLSPAAPERGGGGSTEHARRGGRVLPGCESGRALPKRTRRLGPPARSRARRPRPTPPPATRPRRGRAACSSRRSSLAAAPRGSLPGCGRDGGGGRTQSRAARTGDLRLALPAPRPLGGTWIISVIP